MPNPIPQAVKHIYNVAERAILEPFKQEYISIPSKPARKQFFISRIWPPMYKYWHDREGPFTSDEISLRGKNLAHWIWNNWRLPHRGGKKTKIGFTIRRTDVLWITRKDEVFKEIARLLGVPTASANTPGWITKRAGAMQNVLEKMNAQEKVEFDKEIENISVNGYSEEQRRVYAEKYGTRRLEDSARDRWLEMGMLQLSVVVYRTTEGKLCVEMHEDVANLVGVPERCFEDEQSGKANEIKRVWLDYVRNVLEEKSGAAPPIKERQVTERIVTSTDGFPMFGPTFSPEKLTKKEAEKLLRGYLKQNYSLANGSQTDEVPYADIGKGIDHRRQFIDDLYLPDGFVLRDPHNIKREEIIRFLKHLQDRQASNPSANVFRFRAFKTSRKGGELVQTIYPDEVDPENPPVILAKPKRKRRPKEKATPNIVQVNAGNGNGGIAHHTESAHDTARCQATTQDNIHAEYEVTDNADVPTLSAGTVDGPATTRDNNDPEHHASNTPAACPNDAEYQLTDVHDTPRIPQQNNEPKDQLTGTPHTPGVDPNTAHDPRVSNPETTTQDIDFSTLGFQLGHYMSRHVGAFDGVRAFDGLDEFDGVANFSTTSRPVHPPPMQSVHWDDPGLYTFTPTDPEGWIGGFPTGAWLGNMPGQQCVPVPEADLNVLRGQNPYAPGPEGIDYGVLLNVQSTQHSADKTVEADFFPGNNGVEQQQFASGHSWSNPGPSTVHGSDDHQNMTTSDRRKRTADDLAAAEAEIIPDTQKRRRFARVRHS